MLHLRAHIHDDLDAFLFGASCGFLVNHADLHPDRLEPPVGQVAAPEDQTGGVLCPVGKVLNEIVDVGVVGVEQGRHRDPAGRVAVLEDLDLVVVVVEEGPVRAEPCEQRGEVGRQRALEAPPLARRWSMDSRCAC